MDGEAVMNPVHTLQHGFRTDQNTYTALSTVANYLEKDTYMDKETIAVFLDIAAAFDTICPGLIKRKLLEHGGNPTMVNWYLFVCLFVWKGAPLVRAKGGVPLYGVPVSHPSDMALHQSLTC